MYNWVSLSKATECVRTSFFLSFPKAHLLLLSLNSLEGMTNKQVSRLKWVADLGAECEACRLPNRICQRMNSGLADKLAIKADCFIKNNMIRNLCDVNLSISPFFLENF